MKRDLSYYKGLSIFAFLIFLSLVITQLFWLKKAVSLDQKERKLKLEKLISDLALDINGLGHEYFHGKAPKVELLDLNRVEQIIQQHLEANEMTTQTYFAFYQDSTSGVFKSKHAAYKDVLLNSEIKSCMSCIISFSVARDVKRKMDESDESFSKRLSEQSTFQYYSPVNHLTDSDGKTIWLSLYQPPNLFRSVSSLWYLFVISILLSLALLSLFYYLLRSLAAHKKIAQMKDDFFNNMTHEFKTPLSSIRLASKVLQENKDFEKNQSYYSLIEKESKTLETQIDKLLELSLLENGEMKLQKFEIHLSHLINQIPIRMKPLLEEKGAVLEIENKIENDSIFADPVHLLNTLCNLVENSLKYSQKGVKVYIFADVQNGVNVLSIQDNGPGIDKESQPFIFDRFYRGQKGNQYKSKGFGIGLSYVRSIIQGHNGSIELDTDFTQGTRFIIKL